MKLFQNKIDPVFAFNYFRLQSTVKRYLISFLCLFFALGHPLKADHYNAANEFDLENYLDFAWDDFQLGEDGQGNPHDFVLGSPVWQDFIDFLLDEYIYDSELELNEDIGDKEIYDDLSWLDFDDFAWWLDGFAPHVAGEVMETLSWRDLFNFSIPATEGGGGQANADEGRVVFRVDPAPSSIVADFSSTTPAASPTAASPNSSSTTLSSAPANKPLTRFGLRLCQDPSLNFQSVFGDGVDYGGYQELLYVLWWREHGCLKTEHWKSYLAFREQYRNRYPFLKDAFGHWADPLSKHDIYLGMFESGSYRLDPPTVGDLVEFEMFIGWMELYSGMFPLFMPFEGDVGPVSIPFLFPKGLPGQSIGKRLKYLSTLDPKTKTVKEAISGLLMLKFERPIEHFQAFKAWLDLGDKKLSHQELMDAGGGSLLFFSNDSLMEGIYQGMFDGNSTADASGSFNTGYYLGGWLGGYNEGVKGGTSIIANTYSFGYTDRKGITNSENYQGGAYTASRISATISREATLILATLGVAHLARGGAQVVRALFGRSAGANAGVVAAENAPRILQNAARGGAFEAQAIEAMGAVKNTRAVNVSGLGRSIPDVIKNGITEIKDVVNLTFTRQLRIQAAASQGPFNLIVSPRTLSISRPLQNAVRNTGGTIQVFDPVTRTFRLWR